MLRGSADRGRSRGPGRGDQPVGIAGRRQADSAAGAPSALRGSDHGDSLSGARAADARADADRAAVAQSDRGPAAARGVRSRTAPHPTAGAAAGARSRHPETEPAGARARVPARPRGAGRRHLRLVDLWLHDAGRACPCSSLRADDTWIDVTPLPDGSVAVASVSDTQLVVEQWAIDGAAMLLWSRTITPGQFGYLRAAADARGRVACIGQGQDGQAWLTRDGQPIESPGRDLRRVLRRGPGAAGGLGSGDPAARAATSSCWCRSRGAPVVTATVATPTTQGFIQIDDGVVLQDDGRHAVPGLVLAERAGVYAAGQNPDAGPDRVRLTDDTGRFAALVEDSAQPPHVVEAHDGTLWVCSWLKSRRVVRRLSGLRHSVGQRFRARPAGAAGLAAAGDDPRVPADERGRAAPGPRGGGHPGGERAGDDAAMAGAAGRGRGVDLDRHQSRRRPRPHLHVRPGGPLGAGAAGLRARRPGSDRDPACRHREPGAGAAGAGAGAEPAARPETGDRDQLPAATTGCTTCARISAWPMRTGSAGWSRTGPRSASMSSSRSCRWPTRRWRCGAIANGKYLRAARRRRRHGPVCRPGHGRTARAVHARAAGGRRAYTLRSVDWWYVCAEDGGRRRGGGESPGRRAVGDVHQHDAAAAGVGLRAARSMPAACASRARTATRTRTGRRSRCSATTATGSAKYLRDPGHVRANLDLMRSPRVRRRADVGLARRGATGRGREVGPGAPGRGVLAGGGGVLRGAEGAGHGVVPQSRAIAIRSDRLTTRGGSSAGWGRRSGPMRHRWRCSRWPTRARDTTPGWDAGTCAQMAAEFHGACPEVTIRLLSAYTGHEDVAVTNDYSRDPATAFTVHGYRGGHWYDKVAAHLLASCTSRSRSGASAGRASPPGRARG